MKVIHKACAHVFALAACEMGDPVKNVFALAVCETKDALLLTVNTAVVLNGTSFPRGTLPTPSSWSCTFGLALLVN